MGVESDPTGAPNPSPAERVDSRRGKLTVDLYARHEIEAVERAAADTAAASTHVKGRYVKYALESGAPFKGEAPLGAPHPWVVVIQNPILNPQLNSSVSVGFSQPGSAG